MQTCGPEGRDHGRMAPGMVRRVVCLNQPMVATHGKNLRKDCPQPNKVLEELDFALPRVIQTGCMQRLMQAITVAFTEVMMQVHIGKEFKQTQGFWGRGSDFAEIKVDPKNADIVYTANVVTWKSSDGGKTWNAFRGAPGGDDYHRIWINPNNPDIILIASDQGAIITVNGGETFSSWYNQPTAQFYHVSTDNAFPYNVYSGQQESGSVGIASRGNDGANNFSRMAPGWCGGIWLCCCRIP